MEWKKGLSKFHGMEISRGNIPWHGKIFREISMPWKFWGRARIATGREGSNPETLAPRVFAQGLVRGRHVALER